MPDLVSPGVSVTVTNESFYTSAPTGTIPLIVIATAQDKLQPGTAIVASRTTKATAGELTLITSQRDALQMFGAPRFYNVGGTPQLDNELNEVGLFSLYEFLGIAVNAYAIRADIDLAQLEPSGTEPTGSATNGSYWLDTSQTTWGTFVSNGNPNPAFAWAAKSPIVISSSSLLDYVVQSASQVPNTSASAALSLTGSLVINDVSIAVTSANAITDIVDAINASAELNLLNISAEIFSHNQTQTDSDTTVVSAYNVRLKSAGLATEIDLTGSDNGILIPLGFVDDVNAAVPMPLNVAVPVNSLGEVGDLAVDTVSMSPDGTFKNRMWEKISVVTGSGLSSVTDSWWFAVGTTRDSTVSNGTETQNVFTGWDWQTAEPTVIIGNVSKPTFNVSANSSKIIINATTMTIGTGATTTLSGVVANINAQFTQNSIRANADVYTSGTSSYLRITNYDGTNIQLQDTNIHPIWSTAGVSTAQTYFGSIAANAPSSNVIANSQFTVDIGGGEQTIVVPASPNNTMGNVVALINSAVGVTLATAPGNVLTISRAGTYISVRDKIGNPLASLGIDVGFTYKRQAFYQDYYPALAVPSTPAKLANKSIWINTTSQNRGASIVVKRYANGVWVLQNSTPNTATIPLFSTDATANSSFGAGKTVGSIYAQYNPDSATPTEATVELLRWSGSAWVQFDYVASTTAPQGAPADGALWYNTSLQVDVMVNDGQQWRGYREIYPGTDPNGVIISASAPIAQSTLADLVDYDIWLDTSASTYPTLKRYIVSSVSWTQIDNTDHVTSAGIIFEDARSTAGVAYQYSTETKKLVVSSYVDDDAPDAQTYPVGMLLFNTRYSTNNVKQWNANQFGEGQGAWVTVSGNNPSNGTPYMGSAAQRIMIIQAMQGALQASEDARSERVYFNLLATPGYPECIDEMVTLNTDKKEIAFIVGDTPAHLDPSGTSIVNWATNAANASDNGDAGLITRNDYVGIYYPWALSTNLDGSYVFVPPSMMALRTIAFNDQVAYPWFAPAGFNRGLVTGVNSVGYLNSQGEYKPLSLNQGQRDTLYSNSINPIAYIPNRGLVVYGQKTLSPTANALDRINVARLVNYLKYQLDNVAKVFLFEPNDKQTRDAVSTTFNSFFNNLVGLRAIYDFAVVCDETNNTPEKIDANQLWIDIAIKPAKAIEFIYIPIRLLNTGDPLPNGTR
jgi:hypothetical protein